LSEPNSSTKQNNGSLAYLVESKQAAIHLDLQVGGHLRVDRPGITSSTDKPHQFISQRRKATIHWELGTDGTNREAGRQRQYLTGPEVKKESGRVPSFMSFIADKD
jgi:hypothetical protein